MIDRLRGAQIAASLKADGQWELLADAIHALQGLHKMKTGEQF
jgi:hypothetical protein